jgi:hypothetical protein
MRSKNFTSVKKQCKKQPAAFIAGENDFDLRVRYFDSSRRTTAIQRERRLTNQRCACESNLKQRLAQLVHHDEDARVNFTDALFAIFG